MMPKEATVFPLEPPPLMTIQRLNVTQIHQKGKKKGDAMNSSKNNLTYLVSSNGYLEGDIQMAPQIKNAYMSPSTSDMRVKIAHR